MLFGSSSMPVYVLQLNISMVNFPSKMKIDYLYLTTTLLLLI